MIRIDRFNQETIETAHATALAAAEIDISSDVCYTEHQIRLHYTIDFINSFLDLVIDEYVPDDSDGWTLEQTKSHLNSSGISAKIIGDSDYGSLEIDLHDYTFDLEVDDESKLLLFHCSEYELGLLGQDLVDLMLLLKQEIEPTKIYERTNPLIKKYNQEMTERRLIEATGLGIIREALGNMEYTILASYGRENKFTGALETDWGRLNITSTLADLPQQIDMILQEKQKFEQLLVTFDDEE